MKTQGRVGGGEARWSVKVMFLVMLTGVIALAGSSAGQTVTLDYDGSVVPVTPDPASPNLPGWTATPLVEGQFSMEGLSASGGALRLDQWPVPHALFSPLNTLNDFTGAGSRIETRLRVTEGRLYYILYDGSRQFQIMFTPDRAFWLKIDPAEAPSFPVPFGNGPQDLRFDVAEGQIRAYLNGNQVLNESAGNGVTTGTNRLQIIAKDGGFTPTAEIHSLRLTALGDPEPTPTPTPPEDWEPVYSAVPGWTESVPGATVTIGETRQLMRGVRTQLMSEFRDGTIILNAGSRVKTETIRSGDFGRTWRRQSTPMPYLNNVERSDGTQLIIQYNPEPIEGEPGQWRVTRLLSDNQGLTVRGPYDNGRLYLPPDLFPPGSIQWFHGRLLEMPNGDILAIHQGLEQAGSTDNPWRVYLSRSTDGGINWEFVSIIADRHTIEDPDGLLTRHNWPLYYAVEPDMALLPSGRIIAVIRTANDERQNTPTSQVGGPSDTYENLFHEVDGSGIYPGLMTLDPDKFYRPGPPNAPVVTAISDDGGESWHSVRPHRQARGVQPRIAVCPDGIVAISYGGLSGIPRWGHAVAFSFDEGESWTDEVTLAPYLTTGYTSLAAIGPGEFTMFFNVTPPQPFTNDPAFWVGGVDIGVTPDASSAVSTEAWVISGRPDALTARTTRSKD